MTHYSGVAYGGVAINRGGVPQAGAMPGRPVPAGVPYDPHQEKFCVASKEDGTKCRAHHTKDSPLCTFHKKVWAKRKSPENENT